MFVFVFVHVHEDVHASQRSALYVFLNQVSLHLTFWDRVYPKTWHSLIQIGWLAIRPQESSSLCLPSPFFFYVCSGNQIQVFRQSHYPLNQLLGAIIKNMYVYKYMTTSPLILLCMPCSLLWLNYLYISEALSFIYLICLPGKQSHGLSFRLQHLPKASANFALFSVFAINSAWTDILKLSALYIFFGINPYNSFSALALKLFQAHYFQILFIISEYGFFVWWSVCAPCAWGTLRNQNGNS